MKNMQKMVRDVSGVLSGLVVGACLLLGAGVARAESSPDVCAPLRVQNEASVSLADQPSTTVDILVAFDRNAVTYAKQHGGGVFNYANVAVTKMNTVLANNGMDDEFRFRLVGTMEVDAEATDVQAALEAIRDSETGWAAIKAMREEVGADIVTTLIDTGYAYGTTGASWPLQDVQDVASFAESAYNVCAIRAVEIDHTMTREVGRNMGARDAEHDDVRTLLSTYAAVSNWREQKVSLSYDVFFSPEADTLFDEAVMVTLTPGKAGLDILYTTDGSEPTLTSEHYSVPLFLKETTTVKAAAVYDGRLGPIFTARYLKRDFATALNAPQFVWTTCSDSPWVAQTEYAFDGFAAQSCPEFVGDFGCRKTSWLKATVTGPTEMGFRYQKSQYASKFNVSCDGRVVWSDEKNETEIGGAVWHQAMVSLPEGTHEIQFSFEQGYGYYSGFNGIVLDTVCFDAWSASPAIEPTTTDNQATATIFTGSMTVTLTPPAGRAGTLLYTLDGSDPTLGGALLYTGPFTVDKSVFVQAVFVEPGREASVPAQGYFLERHPVKPGEWTTDVEGVKDAAARDGRLIAVLLAHRADCDWTKKFMPVAESPEFLSWAEANGVYLITADDSERVDTEAAYDYFWSLYPERSVELPTLVFADPSDPDELLGYRLARNDGTSTIGGVPYEDTVESLVRGFAAVMGEASVPDAPTVSPDAELVDAFPVTVTLTNPNATGTIYYTLDGSAPTRADGSRYASPISVISSNVVLKAAVWGANGLSSPVSVKSYRTNPCVVEITLPTGMAGYDYAVSNLTAGAEIEAGEDGRCALPLGAKVGIYVVPEAGCVVVGTNPYVIDEVTVNTVIDPSALPVALPPCTVTIGDNLNLSAAWTSGDGSETNAVEGAAFKVPSGTENVTVIFTAQTDWEIVGDGVVKIGTVTDDIVFGTGDGYRVPEVRYLLGDIPYRDWNGTQMTNATLPKYVFTFVTDETRELDNGWYAVTNDVVFPAYESLAVKGNAHLVLCDGASLTIQSGYGNTAVDARGGSLTIYGQEKGTGALTAMGGSGVAGIGGTVTLNGGTVTATGGMWGAGIGGGQGGAGGVVTINGGTVTAQGGNMGAGIGGGQSGAGGRVTIRGGAVSATGGSGAEDIGRGAGLQDSGAVSVSGGLFACPVQNAWLAADCAAIANPDAATAAEYPWAVVPYPAAWPEADAAVKAKFGDWRSSKGAGADLSTDDAQKAFLLNVGVTSIKELKIESIEVDAEGYATIVVSGPGAFFFDRIDLGEINGILSIMAGRTLETMTPKAVAYWTTTSGKAVIKVRENFIRAVIGFKTPDVAADTLQPEQGVAK